MAKAVEIPILGDGLYPAETVDRRAAIIARWRLAFPLDRDQLQSGS